MKDQSASTGSRLNPIDPNEPTDKKKREKAARIKAHAKEFYDKLIISGYELLATKLRNDNLSQEEEEILKRQYSDIRADLSITFAARFEKTWAKRRGEFVS